MKTDCREICLTVAIKTQSQKYKSEGDLMARGQVGSKENPSDLTTELAKFRLSDGKQSILIANSATIPSNGV
jgi:hypothetical protein